MNGLLNLLKPPGMTSSNAVTFVRRTLSGEKVGHAGTLDPEAAGVLPLMIGKASRLFELLTEKQKEYIAEIAFGASTDTQDAQGKVLERSDARPKHDDVLAVLGRFTGDIMQTPPAYSALKVGGKAAYALAREGEAPVLAPRHARVDEIELLGFIDKDRAMLRVVTGRGVYIRTLCHDIGQTLGCPAHMRFLLRTRSGVFTIEQAVTLEEWTDAEDRSALLTPMDAPIAHLPVARVGAAFEKSCRNGNPLTKFELLEDAAKSGGLTRVYLDDTFAGLARWDGSALRFEMMLLPNSSI